MQKHPTRHSTVVSYALQVQINCYNILNIVSHHKGTISHSKITKQES